MKQAIIRYGVFVILTVMTLGLLLILDRFDIQSKASVNLIVINQRTCNAYIANNQEFNLSIGDSVLIKQTIGGDLMFEVEKINQEPSNVVLQLCPLDEKIDILQMFGNNTFTSGYIFTGKMKLRKLILKQIKM